MIEENKFKDWLENNTDLSPRSLKDVVSRVKRADKILTFFDEPIYQFYLNNKEEYKKLSVTIRSQIKRAVNLYMESIKK